MSNVDNWFNNIVKFGLFALHLKYQQLEMEDMEVSTLILGLLQVWPIKVETLCQ